MFNISPSFNPTFEPNMYFLIIHWNYPPYLSFFVHLDYFTPCLADFLKVIFSFSGSVCSQPLQNRTCVKLRNTAGSVDYFLRIYDGF